MERQSIIAAQRRSVENMIKNRLLLPLAHSNFGGVDDCAGPNCPREGAPTFKLHTLHAPRNRYNTCFACSTSPPYKTCITDITYDCGSETWRNGEETQQDGHCLACPLSDKGPPHTHLHSFAESHSTSRKSGEQCSEQTSWPKGLNGCAEPWVYLS